MHDPAPIIRGLHRRRLTRGYTLRSIAPRVGSGPAAIGAWERGDRQPSLARVYAYAAALGAQPALWPLPGGERPIPLAGCADGTGARGAGLLPVVRQLRAGRHAREWTTSQLGARIGMSGPAVAAWERGDRHMLLPQVYAYAAALGHTIALERAVPGVGELVQAACRPVLRSARAA